MSQSPLIPDVQLLNEWQQLHEEIKALFEKRDNRNVRAPMEEGIRLLIEFILLANDIPNEKASEINMNSLAYKPVNIEERLQFLKLRPTIYPSFIQLKELFAEQQKQYAKKTARGRF